MKVLAIDPGYGRCGMAVVERIGVKDVLHYSVCVETVVNSDFAERLRIVVDMCESLLREHSPDCVAMEKLYFNVNQKTAMRVAEVRGALISAAAAAGLTVHEYTPGEVKSAAAGSGRADKKQVATMVHALVKIDKPIQHDDEYDAIAIGITHLAHSRVPFSREHGRKTVQ
jgi:crossover junction endodeoxyribonuclease RuvC